MGRLIMKVVRPFYELDLRQKENDSDLGNNIPLYMFPTLNSRHLFPDPATILFLPLCFVSSNYESKETPS